MGKKCFILVVIQRRHSLPREPANRFNLVDTCGLHSRRAWLTEAPVTPDASWGRLMEEGLRYRRVISAFQIGAFLTGQQC
ncbi:hypothetical protein DFO68_108102 [Halomonas ventosae]|uniref:Uncharacterized protein n=1 Tax=Halomonas ventosae TaxID=229007 RepID=A0A4R6HHQ1_9GAMM|nr:hypothetical protein DFO68_108102 [Halomonas ventosae]